MEKWTPENSVKKAQNEIDMLGIPTFKVDLSEREDLSFSDLMNVDNRQLEDLLTMYGGYQAYLETNVSDIEATVGALEAAFTESYNTALYKVVKEYEDSNKKKPTKEELRGELFSRFDALKELKQQLIDKEVLRKKTSGLLNTYTTAYTTISRVITLRLSGQQ